MRHGNKINHLGRKTAHRKALLMNLSNSLIKHKRITTTLAKAKELRKHIEPLINKTKVDSTHNRRILFSYLQDKDSIIELFNVIADKVANRPGGYTRIIKLGFRKGDAADIAMIELVDFNDIYTKETKDTSTKTRRSRAKKSATEKKEVASTTNSNDLVEEVIDTPVVEEAVTEVQNIAEIAEEAPAVEEVAPVAEEVVVEEEAASTDAPKGLKLKTKDGADDLKIIEGIGPKIEELLHAKEIRTFEQLSQTAPDAIKEILAEAGSRFTMHDPTTWPQQAQLLFEGKFEEFQKLCDELDGGRVVE